jgi:Flp pilus assembly protein TadD
MATAVSVACYDNALLLSACGHCLGAALYACGDVAAAAEVEARSVELEPGNARYRWALVISLRKLGRAREAQAQAERILALEPAVAAHRARFERLFLRP